MMSTSCFLSRARGSTIACTGIHGMQTCCVGWGCRNDFALTEKDADNPTFCRQLLLQVQVLRLAPRQSPLVVLLFPLFQTGACPAPIPHPHPASRSAQTTPRTASIPETVHAGSSRTWSDAESPDRSPAR